MPTSERKFVRVQEKGQITLPAEVRRRLGLKKGDLVAVEETERGLLHSPQKTPSQSEANRIVEVLQERGLSLDDFLRANEGDRTDILKGALGLPADASVATVRERAKADFFAAVDEIQRRNRDKDPEQVYRDVTAAVEGVRRQRYDQQKA